MYILKCYPKQEEACAAAAGEKRAINPKTWRKYIWPMIFALSDLESAVVSLIFIILFIKYQQHNSPVFQIDFESRKQRPHHDTHMSVGGTDCYIWQKGRTFALQNLKGKSAIPPRHHHWRYCVDQWDISG